jgi:nucleotide-binding universal stress UspA family protein
MDPIMAGTDGSEDSLRAVEWAAREAALRAVPLRVLSVPALPPRMTPDPSGLHTVAALAYEAARDALVTATGRALGAEPGLAIETELLRGAPAQALTDAAAGATLVVLGSRGTSGFAAMALGSVSRYVATHSPKPVVVAREETMAVHREIVVGIGDPEESQDALAFAFEAAALHKARLLALHAWYWFLPGVRPLDMPLGGRKGALDPHEVSAEAAARMEPALARWREKYPDVQSGWEVVHAHPSRVLAGASARADLVVLGRHYGRRRRGIGSVTNAVLNHAHGPVASVPSG